MEVLTDNQSRKAIAAAETVAVQKVVRCKDCAHFSKIEGTALWYCKELDSCRIKRNDYCSRGEMKNGTHGGKGI